jgi:hypothetical protein
VRCHALIWPRQGFFSLTPGRLPLVNSTPGGMMILWFRARIWLANALLDLAEAVASEEVQRERDRLRARR